MTNLISGFSVVRGTAGEDTLVGTPEREVFFGLAGDDELSNTTIEGESYLVGGAGDDTYVVAPDSFTIIHETGDDGGDVYVDDITVGAGDPIVATVDERHLVFNYPQTGTAILFVDWEVPENQIEVFRLYDGVGLVGLSFDELQSQITTLPGFVGDVSLEELGLVEDLEDGIEVLIEAVNTGTLPESLDAETVEEIALLYEAGLGRAADAPGLNFWIDQVEAGLTLDALADAFVMSNEFNAVVGDPDVLSERELVEGLYLNVLEREGDAAGIDFWTEFAERPAVDAAALLAAFAGSSENREAATDLDLLAETVPGYWDFA